MNKKLIVLGVVTLLLWIGVTILTFGLPESFVGILYKFVPDSNSFFLAVRAEIAKMPNGFYYDIDNNAMPTVIFLFLFFLQFIIYLYLIRLVKQKVITGRALWFIMLGSILFRLVLVPGVLVHENDIYRYLWDGKVANHGVNPFKYAPSDIFMYEEGYTEDYYDEYYDVTLKARTINQEDIKRLELLNRLRNENKRYFYRIGHRQVPTIYPPAAQIIFSLSTWIKKDSMLLMKLMFVLFDIGVVWVIIKLLKHFNLDPLFCLVYGWSPLVLMQLSNSGHYDSIVIFFMMLSIYLFFKNKKLSGVISLSLAFLSKFFAGVLLPFFVTKITKREVLIFLMIIFGAYFPYILWDQTGVRGVFQGLMTYNKQWAYNASIFALVQSGYEWIFPELTGYLYAKLTVGAGYLIFLGYLYIKKSKDDLSILKKCFWAVAVLFIINPVGDPWYFCWSIPFLCFFPYRAWIALSGLLVLSYMNFHNDIAFLEHFVLGIPIMNWIIYVPFFILLFCKEKLTSPTNH